MATKNGNSGTYNVSTGNQYISGYVEWTETYDDQTYISTNKTKVTQKVYLKRTNTYSSNYNVSSSGTRTAYFGSETVKNTDKQDLTIGPNPPGNYTCIFTASKEITHDANGSKTITLGVETDNSANIGGFEIPKTTKSVTLMNIPRYASITQHYVSSVTSSSITVYWNADASCDAVQCSLNGGSWFAVSGYPQYTITGLGANTQYSIRTRVKRTDSQLWTESGTIYGTTYATTVPSISISSKTSSSVTVSSSCNVTASSTRYRIMKSGGSYGSWQTSATFSGLSANTTYTVQVEKVGQASGEAGYATVNVTTHQKTIPTISLSSKTINSITVSSGCNVTASSTQYRIKTSSGNYGNYQTNASFTGLSPNTTYVIEVKKVGQASGESGTATLNVTTYQIATISSASNFNLGSSEVVNYSNPSGSTIAIGIYLTDGATALAGYRTASGTSYTFNFTDTELDTIYKKLGTNNSITVRIYLRTTCNSTNYYSTKDVTVTLTGNQKTAHIGVNGVRKRAKVFIGVNGSVKRAVMWIGNNGRKRCI